jgi:hypothetical protein
MIIGLCQDVNETYNQGECTRLSEIKARVLVLLIWVNALWSKWVN